MADIRFRCVKHLEESVVDMTKNGHPVVVERVDGPCGYCGLGPRHNLVFMVTTGPCSVCGRSSGHKLDCSRRAT